MLPCTYYVHRVFNLQTLLRLLSSQSWLPRAKVGPRKKNVRPFCSLYRDSLDSQAQGVPRVMSHSPSSLCLEGMGKRQARQRASKQATGSVLLSQAAWLSSCPRATSEQTVCPTLTQQWLVGRNRTLRPQYCPLLHRLASKVTPALLSSPSLSPL